MLEHARKHPIRTITKTLNIVSTFRFAALGLSLLRSLDRPRGELFARAALGTGIVPGFSSVLCYGCDEVTWCWT